MVPPRDRVARTSGISRQSCVVTGACCAVSETRQSAILVLSPALDAGSSSAAAQQAMARMGGGDDGVASAILDRSNASGGGQWRAHGDGPFLPLGDGPFLPLADVLPLFSKAINETLGNEDR